MGVQEFNINAGNATASEMMVEGKTDDLFDRTIISPFQNFNSTGRKGKSWLWEEVEERYKDFVLLQSMIDSAYIRLTTNDKSFLPLSEEEMCKAEMVRHSYFYEKIFSLFLIDLRRPIYAFSHIRNS